MRLDLELSLAAASAGAPPLASLAAWSHLFVGGVAMLPAAPGNFASWADQAGALSIVPADVGFAQTTSEPSVHFSNNANQRLRAATKLVATNTDFGLFIRAKTAGAGAWVPVGFDMNGVSNRWLYFQLNAGSWGVEAHDGTLSYQLLRNVAFGTTYHTFFVERAGATWEVRIDGALQSPTTVNGNPAVDLSIPTNLSVGNMLTAGNTPFLPQTGDVSHIGWKSGAVFTADERAATIARVG